MFIQTEQLADAAQLRFNPGQEIMPQGGELTFSSPEEAQVASPLAARLFEAGHVARVTLMQAAIIVEKQPAADWTDLKPVILVAIMDHLNHGHLILNDADVPAVKDDNPLHNKIRDIIDERIMPVVSRDGGEVEAPPRRRAVLRRRDAVGVRVPSAVSRSRGGRGGG